LAPRKRGAACCSAACWASQFVFLLALWATAFKNLIQTLCVPHIVIRLDQLIIFVQEPLTS